MTIANTETFDTLVTNASTIVQGSASALVDFQPGSISLAYMEAVAANALWLQGLILQVAALTRLSTSTGSDIDTFLADFNTARLAATAAEGTVTFSRYTPTQQALIPAGSVVQSADGTESFTVIADTTQAAWNAGLNSYVIPAGTTSCNATVQATVAGTGGNVAAGIIVVLAQSIVGVDYVNNALAFTGGNAAQSDATARQDFVLYLQSLTQGTAQACINAVQNLQTGAKCYLTENYTVNGTYQPGYFYCIVDDGTGSPSGAFLTSAYSAIDKVRAEGTTFGVFAPSVVDVTVLCTIVLATGYTGATVQPIVVAAITNYINNQTLGETLPYLRLSQVIFDASPGIVNITGLRLQGGVVDYTVASNQLIRAGAITVSY